MSKRRRGSFLQKKKLLRRGSKTRKIFAWSLCVVAILILIIIGGCYQLFNWIQSDGFRKEMEMVIKNHTQASSVNIPEKLRINGTLAILPSIRVNRVDALQHVSARRITAAIDREGLFNRRLHLTKLNLEEASLLVDTTKFRTKLPTIKQRENSFLARFTPTSFQLDSFECSDADAELLHNSKSYTLTGCNIVAEPDTKENWQINIENGRLHTPFTFLRECSIRSAIIYYTPTNIHLTECLVMLSPGELRLTGNYRPRNKQWDARLRGSKINLIHLLNDNWKRKLSGELFGELKFSGEDSKLSKSDGILTLKGGVLEGLPILSDLRLGNSKPYRTIELEKAECRISYPYNEPTHHIRDAWLFDQIDLRSKAGTLAMHGHLIVGTDGALNGTLTLGIPEATVKDLPFPESITSKIFNGQGEKGYRWLNINLSGTIDEPQEDLSVRLSTIAANFAPEAAETAAKDAINVLQSIFQPVDKNSQLMQEKKPARHGEPQDPTTNNSPHTHEAADIIKGAGRLLNSFL